MFYVSKGQINAFKFTEDVKVYVILFTEGYFKKHLNDIPNDTVIRLFTSHLFSPKIQIPEASKITDYISQEQYEQHNPMVKDGLEGLNTAIEYLSSQNNMFKYNKVHKVLGEGNFVIVQSEGEWNGKPQAFYDLFRVSNGQLVEHWDVIQEIPEKMAHKNGMF